MKNLKTFAAKNLLTLYVKYFADTKLGFNRFTNQGKKIKLTEIFFGKPGSKKILFPTIFYLDRALAWQLTIALSLRVRGHKPIFMPLDLKFPTCNALYFDDEIPGFTNTYYRLYTSRLISNFKLPTQSYSTFGSVKEYSQIRETLQSLSLDSCKKYEYQGIKIGVLAQNQLIHYLRCGVLRLNDYHSVEIFKNFIAQAVILYGIIKMSLDKIKPDIIFTLNGSFIDSQLQLILGRQRGIKVITFEAGFMLNTIMLGINEPIIEFPMFKYFPENYANYSLTNSQNKELDQYLQLRSEGKDCVFDYWGKPIFDKKKIRLQLGLSEQAAPDILFTNLLWDSATINCDIAFTSQLEWIFETISFYANHPERTLIVRIHPAEVTPANLESTDKIEEHINKKFHKLPKNVIIIPPISNISSFPLTEISIKTLVYASTAGLESAIMGKQVIVSGKTHYRSQGFTDDITSKKQYFELLESVNTLPEKQKTISLARKYAYFFFFGFMIPFKYVIEKPTNTHGEEVQFNFESDTQLQPGNDSNLDFIIDTILGITNYKHHLSGLMQE